MGSATLQYTIASALFLAPLAVGSHALLESARLALQEDAYTHIILILPISVALIILEWRKRICSPTKSPLAGSALLVVAIMVAVVALRWRSTESHPTDVILSCEMLAIVIWWIGSFVACFGWRAFRLCLFPLLFLLLLVPLPRVAVNHTVEFLQLGTASCSRVLFTMIGIPALQDGTVVKIPGLNLQVAQQCSSIRSSMILIVSTMVASYVLLRSVCYRALVILVAVPLSIAKNGLRVVILAVLGQYVDRRFLTGWLHHNGGPLFLALSLAVVFALIRFLLWMENRRLQPPLVTHLYSAAGHSAAD